MNNLKNRVLIGLLFILGFLSFISGQIIVSAAILAGTAVYTNKLVMSN